MSRSRESRPRGSRKQQTKITMESDHPKGRKVNKRPASNKRPPLLHPIKLKQALTPTLPTLNSNKRLLRGLGLSRLRS